MSNKLLGYAEATGLALVVLGAALWVTHAAWVAYLFAAGAILLALGRQAQDTERLLASVSRENHLSVRRLLRQRTIALVFLLLASALMFVRQTWYVGQDIYVFPSSWLVPFVCFVVIEVYTAFRLPMLMKR